jgi:3-oxoacyl-[acyl-carrier protein] reductase
MTAIETKTVTAQSKKLQGKVALVTGSSRGIGAAIAMRLAEEGASVAVNYANSKPAAEEVVAKILALGSRAEAFKASVSSQTGSSDLLSAVKKAFGKIDILVNNAGVYEMAPIDKVDLEHYHRLFDTNVRGVIATTIAALPSMNDGGRIINISSGASKGTMAGASLYSATKSALDTLTRVWAQDLGARHITVNAVAPGTTLTEMLQQGLSEEIKQMFIAKTALKRLGEPADIAAVVAFLASDDGGWITGQTIFADGGLTI